MTQALLPIPSGSLVQKTSGTYISLWGKFDHVNLEKSGICHTKGPSGWEQLTFGYCSVTTHGISSSFATSSMYLTQKRGLYNGTHSK